MHIDINQYLKLYYDSRPTLVCSYVQGTVGFECFLTSKFIVFYLGLGLGSPALSPQQPPNHPPPNVPFYEVVLCFYLTGIPFDCFSVHIGLAFLISSHSLSLLGQNSCLYVAFSIISLLDSYWDFFGLCDRSNIIRFWFM